MPVYISHNHDGVNEAMVEAPTLKAAAKRIGTSVYQLRNYGWHKGNEDDAQIAKPTVQFRPMDYRRGGWRDERWTSSEVREAKG